MTSITSEENAHKPLRGVTTLLQIDAGPHDGVQIIIDRNNQHIAISVFPPLQNQGKGKGQRRRLDDNGSDDGSDNDSENGSGNNSGKGNDDIQTHFINLLTRAGFNDDDDEYEWLTDEALGIIEGIGGEELARVAPVLPSPLSLGVVESGDAEVKSLHALLYPKTLYYRVDVVTGEGGGDVTGDNGGNNRKATAKNTAKLVAIDPSQAYTMEARPREYPGAEFGIDIAFYERVFTEFPVYSS